MPLRKEDIEMTGEVYATQMMGIGEYDDKWTHQDKYMWNCLRAAYITGSTIKAEKVNELVEALVDLLKWAPNHEDLDSWNYSAATEKAKQAISNYKK